MKTRVAPLLLLAALVLAGENRARAEMVNFSYSWLVQPSAVIPGGTGSVTFAAVPNNTATAELGSAVPTFVPGANITTTSSAIDVPDVFNADVSFKLTLIDALSSQSGSLTFGGTVAGTLTALQSDVSMTFNNPLTQTLTLGNHVYTVTIDPTVISLPAPGAQTQALVDALINVTARTGGGGEDPPPVNQAPEPSSLLLGVTAMAGLAARRLFRRQAS